MGWSDARHLAVLAVQVALVLLELVLLCLPLLVPR